MAFTYQSVRHELWLYLPQRLEWFNPAHIVSIGGWHLEEDRSVIESYTITVTGGRYGDADTEILIDEEPDVAAVTAWLEARS